MSQNWTLSDVLRYFQEDPEIKEAIDSNEFKRLINPENEFLQLLRTALEYQGFDPRVVMRQIIRNRTSYEAQKKPLMEWDLSNVNDDFKIRPETTAQHRFSNKEPLNRDLNFLIMMFLLRNNHISKIIQKSIQGLSDILEMLKEKYDINDEVRQSGTALGSKDITLPRITSVLPSVAVQMFHLRAVKEIVSYYSIPGIADAVGTSSPSVDVGTSTTEDFAISHAICCPFLPSLHPITSAGQQHIHALMLYVAIRLDDIIHKKEKNYTGITELMSYYKAGYESIATPAKSRLEVFKKIGFLSDSTGAFKVEVLEVSRHCFNALKKMRIEDPNHAILIEAARTGIMPE